MNSTNVSWEKPSVLNRARTSRMDSDSVLAKAYFDYALSGIIVTDLAHHILRANPAACSIIGIAPHRLQRAALLALISPDVQSRARANRHFQLLSEQGITRTELNLSTPSGEEQARVIEIASVDIGEGRLLHVFDDVTAQRQLALATEQARQAADDASRAKSRFLANMSHEIRTPLNGMIGMGELLKRTSLDAEQADYVAKMLQSSRALLALLNDVLDLSKVEAGRIDFEKHPFDIAEAMEELVAAATPLAVQQQSRLSLAFSKDMPRFVAGDRLRLMQVLRNLIDNAIKFTSRGSVSVSVDTVQPPGEPCRFRFQVTDSGIGISLTEQTRLFSAFSQADVSTSRRFGGTGLGLAISRTLVEGMGGCIELLSAPGKGSTFTVSLPLEVAEGTPSTAADDQDIDLDRDEFYGACVLVVDDNAINRDVLARLLEYAGIDVTLAESADQAMKVLQGPDFHPELIFMDVQMPDMDGLALTRAMRSGGLNVRVVGVSAGVTVEERAACAEAGMCDFIAKPIEIGDLAGVLTRWLPPRKAVSAPRRMAEIPAPVHEGEFPGIALDIALPRFLGRKDVLARARDAFVEQYASVLLRLEELEALSDWSGLAGIAHGLKGAAGNIGALELAGQAAQLEEAIKARDRKDVLWRFQAIGEAMNATTQP